MVETTTVQCRCGNDVETLAIGGEPLNEICRQCAAVGGSPGRLADASEKFSGGAGSRRQPTTDEVYRQHIEVARVVSDE